MTRFAVPLLALLVHSQAPAAPAPEAATPLGHLSGMLKDPETTNPTLAALRSTEDKDLAPLFEAMTRSGDKKRRLFGVVALAELVGKGSAAALRERVGQDPAMAVRAESLGRLIEMEAVTAEQIADAMKIPDENVQCIAARALADRGQVALAQPRLEELARSSDQPTAALAQMCLLGMGQRQHEPGLGKVMQDPATPPLLLGALLRQVERQKVISALPLALNVAGQQAQPMTLRVQAYKVAAAISSLGTATLQDAIAGSTQDALRVRLLKVLAARQDAGAYLAKLAAGHDAVAALARFELARKAGGAPAAQTVSAAIALEHPVVVAYVLDCAGEDISQRREACDFYVPGLVTLIESVNPRPREMAKEHFLAAGAASRLVELGTPAALSALKELLAGKVTAVTRSVAAGLLRAKDPAACTLVAPLLSSPYDELSADAALVLGHFGNSTAKGRLTEILLNRRRHPPALAVLASWYLVKIDGQSKAVASQLAKLID